MKILWKKYDPHRTPFGGPILYLEYNLTAWQGATLLIVVMERRRFKFSW